MSNYIIASDSSCDMPQFLAEQLGVVIVPLTFEIGDDNYTNYLDGREIGFKQFYDEVRVGKEPHTSCPSVGAFMDSLRAELDRGNDVLYIGFSSALSATTQNAQIAAKALKEEYPQRKIEVVDSLCASLGQGLLIKYVAEKKASGASIEEAVSYAEEQKYHICHWFTVTDLMYLKRGGRVSATTAMLGTAMSIKPVMHMDNEGRLINVAKARGRKKSLEALVDHMKRTAINPQEQTIFISHGDCEDEVKEFANLIKKEVGFKDVVINYVGPVIGSHTGPGVVALFFVGTQR